MTPFVSPARSMLVAAATFKTSDYAAMLREVTPELPDLKTVVVLDDEFGDLTWDGLLAGGQGKFLGEPGTAVGGHPTNALLRRA